MLEYDADSSGYDMIEHMLFETGYDAPQNQSKVASAAVVVRVYYGRGLDLTCCTLISQGAVLPYRSLYHYMVR